MRFSDWALLRKTGARRLVVGFSPANTAASRFGFYASLASRENDSLLFNSPQNDWSVNGVPLGTEPSFAQTLALIRGVASGYDDVVFLGGSMGGYAALLYGSRFPDAVTVAMGPEIYPGVKGGFVAKQASDFLPPNLSRLFSDPGFRPWIISGEKQFTDMYCLTEISSDRLLSLRNIGHVVPPAINSVAGNMVKVTELAATEGLGGLVAQHAGTLLEWPELVSVLYLLSIGKLPVDRARRLLKILPDDLYARSYLLTEIAKRLRRRGAHHAAVARAAESLEINPGDLEAHLVHDLAYQAQTGHLPAPRFEEFIDEHYLKSEDYNKTCAALRKLHGLGGERPVSS